MLLTVGLIAQGQDSEMQMEAATHRAVVLGDLKGAIEQYRSILAQPGASRTVMAQSLLRLGECLEKLGRRIEAQNTYTRIVREFGDQAEAVGRARSWLAAWEDSFPGPRNLNFDQGVPGKAPPGWFVTLAPPKEADRWAELRRSGCRSSHGCGVVLPPDSAPIRAGGLEQKFSASAYRGKSLRLTAWIRVEATDPDDRAQMWLQTDRAEGLKDLPVRSNEWTRREIVTRVDDHASFIRFGFISFGGGRTWIDDVSVDTIPGR